jgi:phage replication O-like protein O
MAKQERRGFPGFRSPTYTIVPDELFDELLADLSGAELKVLLYIIRRTFGFKKGSDRISKAQLERGIQRRDGTVLDRGTGLSRRAIRLAVDSLVEQNILLKHTHENPEGGYDTTEYALNVLGATSDHGVLSTPPRGKKVPHPLGREVPIQETDRQETEKQHGVVVREALTNFGITTNVADQLSTTYPEAYLLAKLDLVQWLVDSRSPLVGKNPAGYLRRAIEEDYAAPPTYRSPEQRSAAEREQEAEREEAHQQRRAAEAEYAREKAVAQQQLRERYPPAAIAGTALTTTTAWEQALDQLHGQLSRLNYETWLANTALIELTDGAAQIVAPSRFQAEHLTTRLQPLVAQALGDVLGHPVDCRFVSVPELLDGEATPPGSGSPSSLIDPPGEASLPSRPHDTAAQAVPTGP